MDHPGNLPSFDVALAGIAGLPCPDDTAEPRLNYQGMSVQILRSPVPVHFSQPNADQNGARPVSRLNEFRDASLTQAFPVIPQSILDEYVPWNPDKSGSEPDIREPVPANRLNPEHHLTDLSAELANPQNSRPVAVVSPLSPRWATSDNPANPADIVDDKSSQIERRKQHRREYQRERRKNPAYIELERQRRRERHKNPDYAERERKRKRERQ